MELFSWEVSSADGARGADDAAASTGDRASELILGLLMELPQTPVAAVRVAPGYPLRVLGARNSSQRRTQRKKSREEASRTVVAEHELSCLLSLNKTAPGG